MITAPPFRPGYAPDQDLAYHLQPQQVEPLSREADADARHVRQIERQRDFLKTYAARLEAELRAYQTKFPVVITTVENDNDDLAPWISNQEYMSPLFAEYDAQISQANAASDELRRELQTMKADMVKLVARNEELENELENHITKLLRRFDGNPEKNGLCSSGDDAHELSQRCALLGDENQLLRMQESETRQELDHSRSEILELNSVISSLREEMTTLEINASNAAGVLAEKEALEQELSRARSHVDNAVGHMKAAQQKTLDMQIDIQAKVRDAEQYKQLLQDHEIDSEKCIKELKSELTRLNQTYNEASARLAHADQLLSDAQEKSRQLKQSVDAKENDMQGMLTTIECLEKNLTETNQKNSSLSAELTSTKVSLQEAILDRDDALFRAENMAKQKKAVEEFNRDETDASRSTVDNALAKAISEAKAKESTLYEEVRKLQIRCANLECSKHKAEREAKSALDGFNQLQSSSVQEQSEIGERLNQTRAEMIRLENRLALVSEKASQLHIDLKLQSEESQNERSQYEDRIAELDTQLQGKRNELAATKHRLTCMQKELEDSQASSECTIRKRDAMENEMQEQFRSVLQAKEKEISTLQERVKETTQQQEKADWRAVEVERIYDDKIGAMEESHRSIVAQLQKTIRDLRDDSSRLTAELHQVKYKLSHINAEKDDFRVKLQQSEKIINDVRDAYAQAENRHVEGEQLLSAAKESEVVYKQQCANLEKALDKAQLEIEREKRRSEKKCREIQLKCLGIGEK
uniref:Uncharacterized protein n=1 Tax=Spongospora subterranea TaxID=70186 RepID=A0A0H5RCU7_9EUKA|eukprot:CRZ11581.1 hypothetical protein [Spongospora subterranea]